ncbi:MAG: ATP-binding cassette domain-containing protein [Clostridiales bacterium]|nr:ATP-binding cassette domain-containing protein [Clostridiales bacterium]
MLKLQDLEVSFPVRAGLFSKRRCIRAVRQVSLSIPRGQIVGLVGESGCGKSTLARAVIGMQKPTSGQVLFEGEDLYALPPAQFKTARQGMQMVFQDPFSALNPRFEVGRTIAEPMQIRGGYSKTEMEERAVELLLKVGLNESDKNRHPSDFSGGQRQRIGIARAIALNPQLLVLDEPVSALDVSVHAQIMNLLMDLHEELGLTYLFISHNLADVKDISHQVGVMYLGSLMERGQTASVFEQPLHPYTRSLLAAVLSLDDQRPPVITKGDIPSPIEVPLGCPFASRCPQTKPRCLQEQPQLLEWQPGHFAACHFPLVN